MGRGLIRQLTLRLPDPLYRKVRRLAVRQKVSMNRLTQESLEALARQAEEGELAAAYEELGRDPTETDVEQFWAAQAEAIGRGR